MKRYLQTFAGLLAAVVTLTWASGASDLRAQRPAPGVTVDPVLYSGLSFRHLSVFSRGGRSTAVAGHASNPQLYYMGTTGGGVWRTTDAGASWTNISDGFFEAASIGAITVADSNANVIYVGTGSACPRGNISPGLGVYKSTDAGKTWEHIGLRHQGSLISRIKVHPSNPDLVYVAVLGNLFGPNRERGVFRSKDGGRTWEHVLAIDENTGASDLSIDVKNPNILFAGMWTVRRQPWTMDSGSMRDGVYRSTDGGTTWSRLTKGLPTEVMTGKTGVSVSAADPKRVYAMIEAADDQGGVFRSDDGGESWTRTYTGRNLQQRAWYYTHIYADPVDVDTVYGLNVGAFKSTDGGKTFQSANIQTHSDHHDLWINPTNNRMIVNANDGGATVSTDLQRWTPQNNQPTAEIYRLSLDTRWPYWVYGAQQDNSTIAVPSQGNADPYPVGGGESGHIAVDPRDPDIVYAGNYGGTISRQDRGTGISENVRVYADSQTGQRAADMKYRFQWNAPIRISPHDPDIVYTTSQVVHRTRDGGQSWDGISPDLTRNDRSKQQYSGEKGVTRDNTGVEVYGTVFAFEESPHTRGLLWAGSDDGLVHISRDNGKTWQNITPAGMPEGCVNVIDLSAHDPGRAHIAVYRYRQNDFTPYIYQTSDYGKTWKRIADGTNGIPNWHFARVVREDPKRRGLLFAGTEFGLYVSFDDGARWQPFQLNLPVAPVTDLSVYRNDLIVTTQGRGFWIMDNLSVLQQLKPGIETQAAVLYKPEDAYRGGGRPPTFQYWFREEPTAPVTVEVMDAGGKVIFEAEGQPGAGPGGARGRGRGREAGAPPQAGRGRGGDDPPAQAGRGRGRGGRGGGRGGAAVGARQGLNRASWSASHEALFTVPQGIVMWGGRGGGGPRAVPGTYSVKVSSGSWSQTQTFALNGDPRYSTTQAEYEAQYKMAVEVGTTISELYGQLARIRDVKAQATKLAEKAGTSSPVAAATKTLIERLEAVEGEITQLRGEGGQDALNFPGRIDNQWVVLYGNIVGTERGPSKGMREAHEDLKPKTAALMQRGEAALKNDVSAFNAVATKAGLSPIVVKPT
jgi:photosystem II stability/assembly factor-like uncharacterized protein